MTKRVVYIPKDTGGYPYVYDLAPAKQRFYNNINNKSPIYIIAL